MQHENTEQEILTPPAPETSAEAAPELTPEHLNAIQKAKESIIRALDQNGNGELDIQDIIIFALKTPGVHISRAAFLKKELQKHHPEAVVEKAIARTPMQAGIDTEEIDKLADSVIRFERSCVSGISVALGAPGGLAMAATIPADIIQYYGYTLRAAQKLLYLYGFPEISADTEGQTLDSETVNQLILCLGVMNGVAGANNAVKGMAKALAAGVEKKMLNSALTKTTLYPIVKTVAKWFGVRMTKAMFAGFFKKAIPVVGGVVGGGITFFSFKPCCCRLQDVLKDTMLSNPQHVAGEEENTIAEHILANTVYEMPAGDLAPEI